ncbi:hypothetical protein LTR37_007619 [Vermiconidia calcicola]|uniref:Uncharacterized protein n=1 Tax=Vermiconidia calcicola TaxID=1690605 RepID=A0ACC3NCZ5_9PEZI|nr:hypothetical protein LTR37_007619 [Vermiconidia calcicola]
MKALLGFQAAIWEDLVLQASHQRRTVLYATVAVGAMYRCRHAASQSPRVCTFQDAPHRLALSHYGKAISQLRSYMARSDGSSPEELTTVVLVTCLLFICFDMLQGDQTSAISHLVKGLRILFEHSGPRTFLSRNRRDSISGRAATGPMGTLSEVYVRLDADSTMFGQRVPYLYSTSYNNAGLDLHPPCAFNTTKEARIYLDKLTSVAFGFRGKLLQLAEKDINAMCRPESDHMRHYCVVYAMARRIDISSMPHLLARKVGMINALEAWLTALRSLDRDGESPALLLLRIQQFFPWFIISTFQNTRECLHDNLKDKFAEVVDLAVKYVELTRDSSSGFAFMLEPGIIASLYLVGTKCRDTCIRRRALGLLRGATVQEGLWSGKIYAAFVERLINLEEQRARDLIGADDELGILSEEARFSDVVLASDPKAPGYGRLICARFVHEETGELEIIEDRFRIVV